MYIYRSVATLHHSSPLLNMLRVCAMMCVCGHMTPLQSGKYGKRAKLSLHCALENQAGPDVVAALLQAYPAAASTKDGVPKKIYIYS